MISRTVKSGLWYTSANFLVKAMAFITIPIFTRLLTQDQFGEYNNFYSWTTIMGVFVNLGLEATLISAKHDYQGKTEKYVLSIIALIGLVALLWVLVVNVFHEFAQQFFVMNQTYINYIFFYLFFLSATSLFQTWERYRYGYKWSVLISILVALSTTALSIVLVLLLPDRLFGRIAGQVVPVVAIGILIVVFFLFKGKQLDVAMWRYALPVALPFVPHMLSVTLLGSMDKVMLAQFCGASATALYSLAFSCGMIASIFTTSIINMFAPWLSDKLNSRDTASVRVKSKPLFLLFGIFTVALSLIAPELVIILGGDEYYAASFIIPPIILSSFCQFIYSMYTCIEQFERKTGRMALATLSAAGLKYVLNLVCIPLFGYIGAAYTTLLGYAWLALVHVIIVRKMGFAKVYDTKFVFGVMLGSIAICLCAIPLYSMQVARFSIFTLGVIGLGIAVVKNKNRIEAFMRG